MILIGECGDDDHWHKRSNQPELPKDFPAVLPRHVDIEQYELDFGMGVANSSASSRCSRRSRMSLGAEHVGQRGEYGEIVVDEEERRILHAALFSYKRATAEREFAKNTH